MITRKNIMYGVHITRIRTIIINVLKGIQVEIKELITI